VYSLFKKNEIKKVFTPRNNTVNKKMYIHRKELELELKRKINGSKHILIYGDSGCGKSWLYKKVLSDEK
jgi:predicted GTPase